MGRRPDLIGGGLIRSVGGWKCVAQMLRKDCKSAFSRAVVRGEKIATNMELKLIEN